MKLLLILSLLCINNASSTPGKVKQPCNFKKETKPVSFQLAPSIIIVY